MVVQHNFFALVIIFMKIFFSLTCWRSVYYWNREDYKILFYADCILLPCSKLVYTLNFKLLICHENFVLLPYLFYVSGQVYKRLKLTLELVKKEMEISKLQVFVLFSSTHS